MPGLMLSLIGLGFAVWQFLSPAQRELIRVKRRLHSTWFFGLLLGAVFIEFLWPLLVSLLEVSGELKEHAGDALEAIGIVIVAGLAAAAAWLVWPNGDWTDTRLREFRLRLESLIMTGSAHAVVDVLAEAFPAREVADTAECESHEVYSHILADALQHREFVRVAARHRREFIGDLLRWPCWPIPHMADGILNELFTGPDQTLTRELSSTTNYGDNERHHYRIPPDCHVLHALLDHVQVADRLAAYKAIGDAVIANLAAERHSDAPNPEQWPFSSDYENSRWKSRTGTGIWFFRLMVSSAAKQGLNHPMWLMYLAHFVEEILKVLELPPERDWTDYPNPYCYWIADCLECCEDLIRMLPKLKDENPSRRAVLEADYESGSPVPDSLIVMGLCLSEVLQSDRVPAKFKSDRIESLCSLYEEADRSGYPSGLRPFIAGKLRQLLSIEDRQRLARAVRAQADAHRHRPAYAELAAALEAADQPPSDSGPKPTIVE